MLMETFAALDALKREKDSCRLIKLFSLCLLGILVIIGLLTALVGGLAGTYLIAGAVLAVSLSIFPLGNLGRLSIVIRGLLFVFPIIAVLISPLIFIQEAQSSMDGMWRIVKDRGGEGLPLRYKCAIWGGNIIMAIGGAVMGYPEAALQTVFMIIDGPKKRTWVSDFALSSPKIRNPLSKFSNNLPLKPMNSQRRMKTVSIAWRGYAADRRVAFALNGPARLSAEAKYDGVEWVIVNKIRVPIRYPKRARVRFLSVAGKPFYVEEGLFHSLETIGWLHPYEAEWRWTMKASDKRLRSASQ
jgi:hypothetical protein